LDTIRFPTVVFEANVPDVVLRAFVTPCTTVPVVASPETSAPKTRTLSPVLPAVIVPVNVGLAVVGTGAINHCPDIPLVARHSVFGIAVKV
jgi:hypothetical protein